jgi:voltage-gated potassium channel
LRQTLRIVRAVWRDTIALWREFQWSVWAFVLVTLGFGALYNVLGQTAGLSEIPFPQQPYLMLQMMTLQTSGEVPNVWYLALFWYLMPLVAIYVLGRGLTDFARVFFNRGERRYEWQEAVASMMRDHIILIGVGNVGLRVMRALVEMGFDVLVIEATPKPAVVQELEARRVTYLAEDGRMAETLQKAGLEHAQSLVICTSSDQVNMEVIMRARMLNADIRIVARMWQNQFSQELQRFMKVNAVLSASELAAPSFAGAAVNIEVSQTMRINDTDFSMVKLTVERDSFLEGRRIGELQESNEMDIVLHGHKGQVIVQPDNNVTVCAGDTLVIFARHDNMVNIVKRNRRPRRAPNSNTEAP